jgi:DNA-binding NarL/FixJ family response regulator
MKFKIVLADDHQLLLQGITAALQDLHNVEIVGVAENGYEALRLVGTCRPDLLVLDLNMPQLDGLQTLKKLRVESPATKVMVLSNYHQPALIEEIRELGADGYMIKNSSAADLKDSISRVLQGEKVFPVADALPKLKEDSYFFDDFLRKYQLTRREVEIIRLVCQGLSSREIAAQLFLSEFTINTHRKNVLRKTDARNTAELIHFAKANQLI